MYQITQFHTPGDSNLNIYFSSVLALGGVIKSRKFSVRITGLWVEISNSGPLENEGELRTAQPRLSVNASVLSLTGLCTQREAPLTDY
jgi:hypothetical protein